MLDRKVEVDLIGEIALIDIGQQQSAPTPPRRRVIGIGLNLTEIPWREALLATVVVVNCQTDLLEIIPALRLRRRLPHFLNGGDEQSD